MTSVLFNASFFSKNDFIQRIPRQYSLSNKASRQFAANLKLHFAPFCITFFNNYSESSASRHFSAYRVPPFYTCLHKCHPARFRREAKHPKHTEFIISLILNGVGGIRFRSIQNTKFIISLILKGVGGIRDIFGHKSTQVTDQTFKHTYLSLEFLRSSLQEDEITDDGLTLTKLKH